ncbi:citramalate synthase [bacterium]|nr:citramalate synthase [bacterium]
MSKVYIYDTTLRDGNQARGVSFSLEDKLMIAQRLDDFRIDYIEGGWPNPTNQTDMQFYPESRKLKLKHARIAAFGSTRRAKIKPEDDPGLSCLVETGAPIITIFGKSWDLHVKQILKTSLDENLRMVEDSVAYLKKHCEEVIYDAEHFFDGYKENPEYALKTLMAAAGGGADWIVLCDTNGGLLPMECDNIFREVKEKIDIHLGIHVHNDSGCAEANTLICVARGAEHVQGTINGIGERCGNANLCTIIPDIELKLNRKTVGKVQLTKLRELSLYVSEVANLHHNSRLPFVGESAFSHKGGAHIDGVLKERRSFEHIDPSSVGNERTYILSDQAGGSTIVEKLNTFIPGVNKKDPRVKGLLKQLKDMEGLGYQFEAAEASFRLLAYKAMGMYKEPFKFRGFRVIEEKRGEKAPYSEATIQVEADGILEHTAAEGDGPVNALDNAIRKALSRFYPQIRDIRLTDYKVLVINAKRGTAAKVRVLIESTDGQEIWGTVGVSENVIEASWLALIDSLNYKLMMTQVKKKKKR